MSISKCDIDKLVSHVNNSKTMKEKREAINKLKTIKDTLLDIVEYNENIESEKITLDNIDAVVDKIKEDLGNLDINTFDIGKKKQMLKIKKDIEDCIDFLDSIKAEFYCETEDGDIINITDKIKKQFTINKILD